MVRQPYTYTVTFALLAAVTFGAEATNLPDEIAASGEKVVLQVHAEGAQIYECKATASGQLSWQFREPIAALVRDGVTVGRHYGGPTWEIEGSSVAGKVSGHAPGATAQDIPWLRLDVSDRRGDGPFKDVTTVTTYQYQGGQFRRPVQ